METVLCYGDSNTWGYVPETDGRLVFEERWPGVLQEKLGADFRVIENGLCGRTTCFDSDLEPFVNGYPEALICAEVNAPIHQAVLMLGTNDCKELYGSNPREIAEHVRQIAEVFQAKGADILILGPAPMRDLKRSPFGDEFGAGAEEKSRRLPACLEQMAGENGWKYLETGRLICAGGYDGIHLTAQSHRRLGEAVAGILLENEACGRPGL